MVRLDSMTDEAAVRPYWAAEVDPRKLIERALERVAMSRAQRQRSGQWDAMRASLLTYYGRGTDGMRTSTQLRETGEDGETVEMHINHVRPIITNALSLVYGQPPKVTPVAVNDDAKSLAEARLAKALHEYYDRKSAGEARLVETIRGGLIASTWTVAQWWNPRAGEEWSVDPDTGEMLYEGDYEVRVVPPWRVAYDFSAATPESRAWCLIRYPVSRYDTAAGFVDDPEKYRKLCMHNSESLYDMVRRAAAGGGVGETASFDVLLGDVLPEEDVLWVWELRHRPTPALPSGRLVRFVEPDIILWDSAEKGVEYPYSKDDLHCYEYAPERVVGSTTGHTASFDLLGMQDFMDLVGASMATTINVNGQQRWWAGGENGGSQIRALGLNGAVLETVQKPEVLDFPALKPEVLGGGDWVLSQMRQAMSLNDVVMGQPAKGMPASAQALQRAQAQQFHAVAQGEAVRLTAALANGRLRMLKRFAKTKRVAEIAGESRKYEMKEWSSDDIASVERFDVEPINPITSTLEFRQSFGEMLVQRNLMTPEAWLAFVQTGSLEQGLDTQRQRKELVESNVALLRRGIGPPPVDLVATQAALAADPNATPVFVEKPGSLQLLKSDPHHIAVPAYLGVLASPASRGDARVVRACLEAVQFSVQLWSSLTPDEAQAYGIPPLPSSMMGPMMAPLGAPVVPPPAAGGGGGDGGMDERKLRQEAGQPPLPAPPEDPLTGAQQDAGATGLPS